MTRSRSYIIAAILQFLLSASDVVTSLIYLPRGAAATDRAGDSPPYVVFLITIILGAVGMVAAYGVLRGQRWSVILTIVLRTLDGFAALPGLLSPNAGLRIVALVGVALSLLVIVLLLRRDRAGSPLTRDSSAP